LLAEQPDPVVIGDRTQLLSLGLRLEGTATNAVGSDAASPTAVFDADTWLAATASGEPAEQPTVDGDDIAVLLYTSGTTSEPKAAVLRHRHLASYVLSTVEFASAEPEDATLVSVPPYHIAGVANLLSNVYAGRRIVYLDAFSPTVWLDTVRRQRITHAMVVPTMLARINEAVSAGADPKVPTLRSVAYGGARMPLSVIEATLATFPQVDFVNAYGLTETSSTIAVLGPEDHRTAFSSDDPAVRARLGSAGRAVPGIEIEVRDADGTALAAGVVGEIFVRGEQVSGEYLNRVAPPLDGGWFPTADRGHLDQAGYLFVEGRADDTIIRGGENIAPAEIEDLILRHPDISAAVVVGPSDEEWGQRIAAVVVPADGATIDLEQLRAWLKERLRSSRTPDEIHVRPDLPHTDTGKLLRRQVLAELEAG
jgi:acyl-CoA synthetase (AMP-forming)/AMP-acid ligase II